MRWVMLIIAVGSFVMGLLVKIRNPVLPSDPVVVSVSEAIAKLDIWKSYVSLSAEIDLESRIFSTAVPRPAYSLKDTNEVYAVELTSADPEKDLAAYLGSTVRINHRGASGGIKLQMVEDKVGKDRLVSSRSLVLLEGTSGKVWVLSGKMDDSGKGDTRVATGYEGVLTRFADFDKNLDSYIEDYSLKKIKKHLKREQEFDLPEDAFLLIKFPRKEGKNHFYCPIKDSNHSLYAVMSEKLAMDPPDTLVGILESRSAKEEGSLGGMLTNSPPDKIGVISHGWTADQQNKRSSDTVKGSLLIGGIALLFAVVGFLRSAVRKRRKVAYGSADDTALKIK